MDFLTLNTSDAKVTVSISKVSIIDFEGKRSADDEMALIVEDLNNETTAIASFTKDEAIDLAINLLTIARALKTVQP